MGVNVRSDSGHRGSMSGQIAVTEGQCQVRQRSWGSMSGQIVVMGVNVRSDSGHRGSMSGQTAVTVDQCKVR